MCRAILSKSLIQFSVDGWGYVPSLLFDLRSNYGGGNEDNGNLLQQDVYKHCHTQCPWHSCRPTLTHTFAGYSSTLTDKSGSVSCGLTALFSWVLGHTRFYLCPPRVCSLVLCMFCNQIPLASKVKLSGVSQSLCQIPRWGNLLWVLQVSLQCENFFGITVLQFVGCLLGDSVVGLMATSSKRAYATSYVTQVAAPTAPAPVADYCWCIPLQETQT